MKDKYHNLVEALRKANVPCRVVLDGETITVECGWNYPDRIFNKVDDALESVGLNSNIVDVCAESSYATKQPLRTNIAGGPKRY